MSFLLVLFSLLLFPFYTSSAPLTLPLYLHPASTSPSPSPSLSDLAAASLLRANHLKKPKPKTKPTPTRAPLSSHSYGGYSLTLSFGTPPQPLPLLLDTGSPLPWLPCTPSYLCRNCPPSPKPFIPKLSSTSKLIGCRNPKCRWIHQNLSCPSNSTTLCPPYFVIYGSGSTAGLLLSESLSVSDRIFSNVAVGCSLVSDRQPSGGIAGFGRGPISLPAQLNLTRFSYCLVSRRYDDNPRFTGSLVLNGHKDDSADGVRFTPFLKNPTVNDIFVDYYYIGLNKITVEGKKVKIPEDFFETGADGNGGVIIDSGTTFTYMERTAFEPLVAAFVEEVEYQRDPAAEERTGLRPCFELPEEGKEVRLPRLAFHFQGGAEMRMPLENYFAFVGELTATVCLTVVSDDGGGGGVGSSGPSMILGSFQQQNYYVVYDLERGKLGFRQEKSCVGT